MNIKPLQHCIIPQHEFPELDYHVTRIQATAIDMADNLIVQAITQAAKEDGITDLYLIDKKFAADAIREKLEREDPKPLTLEELRQMEGEPVWVKHYHGGEWVTVHWDYVRRISYSCKACLFEHEYGRDWIAYRHKPKEVPQDA